MQTFLMVCLTKHFMHDDGGVLLNIFTMVCLKFHDSKTTAILIVKD